MNHRRTVVVVAWSLAAVPTLVNTAHVIILTTPALPGQRPAAHVADGVQEQIVALLAKLRRPRTQLQRNADLAEETLADLTGEIRSAPHISTVVPWGSGVS